MPSFLNISTSTRTRIRSANSHHKNVPIIDIYKERKKRESELAPEVLEQYKRELEELKKPFQEYLRRIGVKNGGTIADYYMREQDFIIGKYLGQDVRKYPDYVSGFEIEKRENALPEEELTSYKKELAELRSKLFPYLQERGIKDGSLLAKIYLKEKDYIIGKYLGEVVRKDPDYESVFVEEEQLEENHVRK